MRQISTRNIGWFFVSFFCYWVLSHSGFYKYIFILLIAFLGLGIKKFRVPSKYFIILIAPVCYFFVGFFSALANLNITKFSFKVSCFVLIPAIAAICIFNMIHLKDFGSVLDMQFWAIAVISIVVGYEGLSQGRLFESQYAYILGAYVIYYYAFKRKGMFLAAAFFTFLANKRITLAAVVASIFLYTVIMFFKNRKIQKWVMNCVAIGTVCVCYVWIALVKRGTVYDIFSALHIESNGRINIWNKINEYYEFGVLYFGKGMGFVTHYLNGLQIPGFDNLHSDLLLIYIETGFWGLGLCVISYFYMIRKKGSFSNIYVARKALSISLIVYTIMNYLTDNTLIYINYWLPMYLLFLGLMFAPIGCREEEKLNADSKI